MSTSRWVTSVYVTLDGFSLRDVGWLMSISQFVASVYITLGDFCLCDVGWLLPT